MAARLAWFGPVMLAILLAGALGHAQEPEALVRVDAVARQPFSQTVPVIGRLVARQTGEVAARIEGAVDRIEVEVGDRIEAGETIARLDPETLTAERILAEGRLKEAEAAAATTRAELALAKQALQRLERLKTSAAFSQARYDDAVQSVAIAESRAIRAGAAVGSARAELNLAEIDLAYTRIAAPYSGVVTRKLTEEGAYLQTGDPVVRLIADRQLEVEVDVPFLRLAGLLPGTSVAIRLDDGSRHDATVRAVLPSENPLTRTRTVRLVAAFKETAVPLANAQSVTVFVPAAAAGEVVTVHKDAVIRTGTEAFVFVVEGNAAERRTVELGEAVGTRLQVESGLAEGELVVIRGNERLTPGQAVRIAGDS